MSIEDIAKSLQCSPTTVARAARALGLGQGKGTSRGRGRGKSNDGAGTGNGRRYSLDVAQADRLRRVVEGLLRVHKAHRAAGRRRGH